MRTHPSRSADPDVVGVTVRDGVELAYEVYDAVPGAPTVHARPDVGDRPVAVLEGADRLPRAALPRRSRSTAGAAACRAPGRRGRVHRRRVRRRHRRGARRDRDRHGRAGHGVVRCVLGGARRGQAPVSGSPACSRSRRRAGWTCPRPVATTSRSTSRSTPPEGWAKYNKHYWLGGGYDDFVEFFFARMFPEPHSTKQIEDCIGWAHELTPQTLADSDVRTARLRRRRVRAGRPARPPGHGARCSSCTAPTTGSARTRSASGWPS